MSNTIVGVCTIRLYLPGTGSLKEKRSILKSMLNRLHNTFNLSAAEVDQHDVWQSAVIAIAVVSNTAVHSQQVIDKAIQWIESNFPDTYIVNSETEIL